MLPKIDTNFGLIHWTDAERNKEYHLLPEALADKIVIFMSSLANFETSLVPSVRDEARAILEALTGDASSDAKELTK